MFINVAGVTLPMPKKQQKKKLVVEKFSKNEKEIDIKRKKTLWFILGIIGVTIFLLFANLGLKIRYLIYDELQVEINPLQKTVSLRNDETLPLSFEVQNRNFHTCSSTCEFVLTDTYTGKVLGNRTLELRSNQKVTEAYNIGLDVSGEGQRIYYFEAYCSNIKTAICQTDGETSYRSSIITINYTYSESEQKLLDRLKEGIALKHDELSTAKQQEEESEEYISEINKTIPTNKYIEKKAEEYLKELEKAVGLYNEQKLKESDVILSRIPPLDYSFDLDSLKNQVAEYNRNAAMLSLLNSTDYLAAYDFYARTNISESAEFEGLYKNISVKKLETFENITKLSQFTDKFLLVSELVAIYPARKNNKEISYKNVNLLNYGKFENLTFNFSGEICPDAALLENADEEHNYSVALINYSEILVYCNTVYTPLPAIKTFEGISLEYKEGSHEIFVLEDDPPAICCIYGNCSHCSADPKNYPTVFVHGHSFNIHDPPESSIKTFTKIQKKLTDEHIIINAGDIDYSTAYSSHWSLMALPVGVRATYYYLPYYETELIFKSIKKEEGIESYSLRLKEIIDIVLANTGTDKVNIVAHSMGGLVTRNYLSVFGESHVNKVVLIGTPNNGISGRADALCSHFADKKACDDMSQDSIFLKRLDRYRPDIPVYLIIGKGCETDGKDGDGVVTAESSALDYADTTYINGKCQDFLNSDLHGDLLDPEKYPEAYNRIKEIITE